MYLFFKQKNLVQRICFSKKLKTTQNFLSLRKSTWQLCRDAGPIAARHDVCHVSTLFVQKQGKELSEVYPVILIYSTFCKAWHLLFDLIVLLQREFGALFLFLIKQINISLTRYHEPWYCLFSKSHWCEWSLFCQKTSKSLMYGPVVFVERSLKDE